MTASSDRTSGRASTPMWSDVLLCSPGSRRHPSDLDGVGRLPRRSPADLSATIDVAVAAGLAYERQSIAVFCLLIRAARRTTAPGVRAGPEVAAMNGRTDDPASGRVGVRVMRGFARAPAAHRPR